MGCGASTGKQALDVDVLTQAEPEPEPEMSEEEKADARRKKEEFLRSQRRTSTTEAAAREKMAAVHARISKADQDVKAAIALEKAAEEAERKQMEREAELAIPAPFRKQFKGAGAVVNSASCGVSQRNSRAC